MAVEKSLVLVVDDSSDNREMYVQYLEMVGHRVIEAVDGREAVARALSHSPHAIVMDLSLPVMTGWEAMALLKDVVTESPGGWGTAIYIHDLDTGLPFEHEVAG